MACVKPGVLLAVVSSIVVWSAPALADLQSDAREAAGLQKQVASIMDVLRAAHADPSTECSTALDDMHTTDEQLRQLSGAMQYDNETAPVLQHNSGEMGVGRDVLISDMQDTVSACAPQATEACGTPTSPLVARSCATFERMRAGGAQGGR